MKACPITFPPCLSPAVSILDKSGISCFFFFLKFDFIYLSFRVLDVPNFLFF